MFGIVSRNSFTNSKMTSRFPQWNRDENNKTQTNICFDQSTIKTSDLFQLSQDSPQCPLAEEIFPLVWFVDAEQFLCSEGRAGGDVRAISVCCLLQVNPLVFRAFSSIANRECQVSETLSSVHTPAEVFVFYAHYLFRKRCFEGLKLINWII